MGHQIDYHTLPGNATNAEIMELTKYAYDPQETCCYHGNLTIHREAVYKDREEAEEAISKFDTGWYSDHAVLFLAHDKAKPNARMVKLDEMLKKLRSQYTALLKKNEVTNFKASFLGCPNCQSKIAKGFIRSGSWCPVCGKSMKSKSSLEAEQRMKKHIEELQKEYDEVQRKNDGKMPGKTMFLVKVEWHC